MSAAMKRNLLLPLAIGCLAIFNLGGLAAETKDGFKSLMDGKTLDGWKKTEENQDTWTIEEGAFVAHGKRCHLFYVGDDKPFKNFHLKVEVMTEPGANGGIYFHTKYQPTGWPKGGFECQVNNSHSDWKKTGSLYDVCNVAEPWSQDNKWWTQDIIVKGNNVTVKVDGKIVLSYTEPPGAQPGKEFERKIAEGTFAFQAHDPGSTVMYKNVRVKRL